MVSEPIQQFYAPPTTTSEAVDRRQGDALGWAILAVPVIGGVVGPLLTLIEPALGQLVGLPVLVATLLLVNKDAPRWGLKPSKQTLGLIFLWMIYFPLYFHRRAAKGAPPRVALAIASEFLYVGGFFALGFVRALVG